MPDQSIETIIVSPNAADVEVTRGLLTEAGFVARSVEGVAELAALLPDRVGCGVIVEEAIDQEEIDLLSEALRRQPAWCDFPLIIINAEDTAFATLFDQLFPYTGNLTLLTRPLSPSSLISAVRVAQRARSRQYQVRDLLQQREESMRRRDEFLAMLAHELRNPLAPIRNAAEIMESLQIKDPILQRAQLIIEKQVFHMTRLIDDLLDVSRLELGKVQLQKQALSLNSAVNSALESCATLIREKRHTVTLELSADPLYVEGDTVRVEQIISNLVSNAAKYTPPGGKIRVCTFNDETNAGLSVEDNGVGISAGLEQGIFELFRQDQRTLARSEGGLGIGLTVAKRLVELHHGTIHAESLGVNKGARFTVKLPLTVKPQSSASFVEKSVEANARSHVLIIEDNPDIRETLQLLLGMWGHEVHLAETGPEGVRRASELKPDVALVDIGLPGLTGFEVAREIRRTSREWTCAPKLIAMTGYGQSANTQEAKEAGFDEYLLKPVEPNRLRQLLTKVCVQH